LNPFQRNELKKNGRPVTLFSGLPKTYEKGRVYFENPNKNEVSEKTFLST
jgi:hypothetical protein